MQSSLRRCSHFRCGGSGYNFGGSDFSRGGGSMQRPGVNTGVGSRGDRTTNIGSGNTVINNPAYGGGGYYGWNGGMAWAPAYGYWGGGFWGAMAIGVTSAAVFGWIVDDDEEGDQVTYNSYEVQPNTPGATFLTTYQLTQVACGPANLVVVYGPEQSVICANPNSFVGAGKYQLDTQTLSLVSMEPAAAAPAAPAAPQTP